MLLRPLLAALASSRAAVRALPLAYHDISGYPVAVRLARDVGSASAQMILAPGARVTGDVGEFFHRNKKKEGAQRRRRRRAYPNV